MGRKLGTKNGEGIITVCLYCGKNKKTNSSARKFCSRKCFELNKRIRIIRLCKQCGKEFECRQPNGHVNQKKEFCNNSCASKWKFPKIKFPPRTKEWNEKIGNAQRGERGSNWKGGIWLSQPQHERKTIRYKKLRKQIFERDGYACVLCGSPGFLHVDHIKSYSKYPELRYEVTNLRTLCMECHKATPTFARG